MWGQLSTGGGGGGQKHLNEVLAAINVPSIIRLEHHGEKNYSSNRINEPQPSQTIAVSFWVSHCKLFARNAKKMKIMQGGHTYKKCRKGHTFCI